MSCKGTLQGSLAATPTSRFRIAAFCTGRSGGKLSSAREIIRRLQEILDQLRCGEPDRVLTLALYPASKIFLVGQDAHQAVLEVESTEASSTRSVGRSGLTTPVMQKLCGIDDRCYGAIFAREVHHRRAELSTRNYCRIGVETVIALRLGDDLREGGDGQRIAAAVESYMAAIELFEDLRYDYKRLDAATMVAGNVWNAGVVLGTPVTNWRAVDLAQVTTRLSINGREIGSGRGSDVMGRRLNALAWLADGLAASRTPLRRGMIVMTGSMVPIQYPVAGDRVLVEISGLGTAELAFR